MKDTAFVVPPDKVARLAANYKYARKAAGKEGFNLIDPPATSSYLKQPKQLSGGGGLVSTAADYLQFTPNASEQRSTEWGNASSARKTVELMTTNHMPHNGDLTSMGQTGL